LNLLAQQSTGKCNLHIKVAALFVHHAKNVARIQKLRPLALLTLTQFANAPADFSDRSVMRAHLVMASINIKMTWVSPPAKRVRTANAVLPAEET
jgi:hypothetical protein